MSALVLTPPRKMSEDIGNAKDDVFIGYSVHFDNTKDRKRVLNAFGG